MLGFMIDLHDVRHALRGAFDGQVRAWAGAAFMVLAMASIQYDEAIAPGVSRISDACSGLALDFGRKLTSFTF